jgi:[ribosomal protein S5]-alanine N-acetyltransferase
MNLDAFDHPPTFNTKRLRIRPLEEGDAEAIFAIKEDGNVTERYGQEPHTSLDMTRRWVSSRLNGDTQRDSVFWVFERRKEAGAIGSCCFWHFDKESNCAELGYELNRAHWRKGMMSEVLPPVLTYGFEEMGLHRIEACPLAENTPSRKLLLKLGFKYEGKLRERVYFRGRYLDQLYYRMLREDLGPTSNQRGVRGSIRFESVRRVKSS